MRVAFAIAALLALAACGRPDHFDDDTSGANALPSLDKAAPSPTGGKPSNAIAKSRASLPAPASSLPARLRGKWGLTPVDCTTTRGDAKGLLIIEADSLKFYESRAVPEANIEITPDSIEGNFEFGGEGQIWTRHELLQLRDDKLVRTERNPGGSFTYVRC